MLFVLIKELQSEMGMAVIMITHDLGVIAETSEEMVVMYAGRVASKAVYTTYLHRRDIPTPMASCNQFQKWTAHPRKG